MLTNNRNFQRSRVNENRKATVEHSHPVSYAACYTDKHKLFLFLQRRHEVIEDNQAEFTQVSEITHVPRFIQQGFTYSFNVVEEKQEKKVRRK